MRVALVVERFGPAAGGVEAAAWNLARELARREIEVTAICRVGADAARIAVERLAVPATWQPLRIALFSRRAATAASAGRFDVVHGFARTREQQIYRAGGGSHAAYLERVYALPRLQRLSPRHAAILRIEEAVFRDARQIVQCNARHCAEEIRTRYGVADERLVTIYNGVDTERFHPKNTASRERARRALELGDAPCALFVGSGFRRKGLDRAIDGLANAPKDAVLLVAGGDPVGPWTERARRAGLSDRVRFLGLRDDVADLHDAADLFVLPTRYDAFSNACLEAMASGLPVATTPDNGASEVLTAESGWVLETDFGPAFEALGDVERLRRRGAAARATAETFTWARHADEVVRLYHRVVGTR